MRRYHFLGRIAIRPHRRHHGGIVCLRRYHFLGRIAIRPYISRFLDIPQKISNVDKSKVFKTPTGMSVLQEKYKHRCRQVESF
ncbi:MAG TPA: hypothetical protein PLX23_07100 [Candidatus Hydrogenedens sp.]|nr:hypothetical protein [Candidatus Hydrogenedens sp.]